LNEKRKAKLQIKTHKNFLKQRKKKVISKPNLKINHFKKKNNANMRTPQKINLNINKKIKNKTTALTVND
jgi:hypothetical protein